MKMHNRFPAFTVPLAFQSAESILKPKRGIEETYKAIRNRLRKYSASSIVDQALAMLWIEFKDPLEELRSIPWLTLLVVKWALQDKCVNVRVGPSISVEEMDQIRQQLWEVPSSNGELADDRNVFLMLRSYLNVQLEFQRHIAWSFLRWPALYARLPEGKPRQQFRAAFGMEPNTFIDLTFALYAMVLSGEMPLDRDCLAPCRRVYGDAVDRIYSTFVRDLVGLRAELRGDAAQLIRGKNELYEFPFFKRFPLIRLRDGRIHCWHRIVFARGVEEAVHLRLSEQCGEDYTRSFSRVFENYVTELAADTGKPYMPEDAYKGVMGAQAPAVEVIFDGEDCNILVEAKMGLYQDDVVIQDSEKRVFEKTKKIRGAIAQGWKVGKLLRDHSTLKDRFSKEQDFLVVVTSRDLLIGGGEGLKRLYAPGAFCYPDDDPDAVRRLPLTNVFVVAIEDYELVMSGVKVGLIDLPAMLKKAAEANQHGQTARLFLADFMREHLKACPFSPVLEQAKNDAETRVTNVFQEA